MVKSKIYTRTGDAGTTGLYGGKRIDKDHPLLEAYGTIDELSAFVGLTRAVCRNGYVDEILSSVQHQLFTICADLATPTRTQLRKTIPLLVESDWRKLEQTIDYLDERLPPLKSFVLAYGSELVARLHLCRTVVRRAERRLVKLSKLQLVRKDNLIYLNRLSDLFFTMARYIAHQDHVQEVMWDKGNTS